jgi:hypothetical protein
MSQARWLLLAAWVLLWPVVWISLAALGTGPRCTWNESLLASAIVVIPTFWGLFFLLLLGVS